MEENPMEQTGILQWLKFRIKKIRMYFRKQANEEEWEEDAAEGNPFLPQLRWILEQALEKYGMDYRIFRPLLLDTDTPPESMLEEDDAELPF